MVCEPDTYRRDLLENLDTLEAVIHRAVITYARLQLQSQDVQINLVQAVDDTLDAGSVITKSSGTKSDKHDTSSSSRTYITHAVDADIRPVNDQVPFVEVQSPKTRNNNKPVEPKSHTQKPGRQIAIGQRFSLNKSSTVHEKPNTPRSCLRWIPTGRIFKLAGLRWIPTRKLFDSCTSKVDSEPPNGSNDDITNPYECNQTLWAVQILLNLSDVRSFIPINGKDSKPRSSPIDDVCSHQFRPRSSMIDDIYPVAVAAPRPVDPAGSPLSTTIDQDVPSASTSPTNQEFNLKSLIKVLKNKFMDRVGFLGTGS
ncbi:hypothetical protein Tco_0105611 [Tanacetum coccineum]